MELHFNFFIRSFKGNRKRPRTETGEGASDVKKEEKEEKDQNGSKEGGSSTKEVEKESEKKADSAKSGEGSSSSSATDEAKGRAYILF